VDVELVRVLLEVGAVVDPGGQESPLGMAAESGHVEGVELLVSEGADVDKVDYIEHGPISTPLLKAVGCQDYIPIEV
jgi:hypothetical protein